MTLPLVHAPLLELSLQGKRALLRVPRYGEIFYLIPTDSGRVPATLDMVVALLMKSLVTIDGGGLTMGQARALAADAATVRTFLAHVMNLLETLRDEGQAYFRCPHCPDGEVMLKLPQLCIVLANRGWPLFDGAFLAHPSLSQPLSPGVRPPSPPPARAIRFVLPSRVLGLGGPIGSGTLGHVDPDPLSPRDASAWSRWAPWEPDDPPEEHRHWTQHSSGFRALVRLCLVLEGGVTDVDLVPEIVEQLVAPDVHFLDGLYYLTHNASVPRLGAAGVACPECQRNFLPVR